jgi:hypothetical protein
MNSSVYKEEPLLHGFLNFPNAPLMENIREISFMKEISTKFLRGLRRRVADPGPALN